MMIFRMRSGEPRGITEGVFCVVRGAKGLSGAVCMYDIEEERGGRLGSEYGRTDDADL